MTDITTNVEAKMILHLEAKRVEAINEAKRKNPSIITEEKVKEVVNTVANLKEVYFYSCVPNIKVPTWEQMLELRHGKSIIKIKEEAREHFKKEEL